MLSDMYTQFRRRQLTWKPLIRPCVFSLLRLLNTAFSDLSAASDALASSVFDLDVDTFVLRTSAWLDRDYLAKNQSWLSERTKRIM